jgi:hypothetical protein
MLLNIQQKGRSHTGAEGLNNVFELVWCVTSYVCGGDTEYVGKMCCYKWRIQSNLDTATPGIVTAPFSPQAPIKFCEQKLAIIQYFNLQPPIPAPPPPTYSHKLRQTNNGAESEFWFH